MALFPFILVDAKESLQDKVLINHETIHLRQQAELLIIPFYILYLVSYAVNLVIYRNHYKAYLHIVFEQEAYRNEASLSYLNNRRWFAWYSYF